MQDANSSLTDIVGAPCSDCASCASCASASGEPVVDRLTFLKQSAAAIAALALAACGASSLTAPSTLSSTTISLANNPALANVGGVVTMNVDGSPVAVVRESTTTFAAFSMICPHQGSTVRPQGSGFYCSGHGAMFTLTGQWTGGQRTSNLRSYPATYDAAAGTVTIGG